VEIVSFGAAIDEAEFGAFFLPLSELERDGYLARCDPSKFGPG
jgi:hypothetical protein